MTIRAAGAALPCILALALWGGAAQANGYLESGSWQFQTSADRANKALVVDLIERKKGGYYDAFRVHNNYYSKTYIERQVNCQVSSTATGNQGTNGMTANSHTIDNGASTSSSTTGNSAHNGIGGGAGGPGTIGNDQSNDDSTLNSGVSNSHTHASTGPVNGGSSSQVLNSDQQNSGDQFASVTDSQACTFATGALN